MPRILGPKKIAQGHYEYKGWTIRQLTKFRWRGSKLGVVITKTTMSEVVTTINVRENYQEEKERKSI